MDQVSFRYTVACTVGGCPDPPRYKVEAAWSYGPLREFKNYGLACEGHREAVRERARRHRDGLAVGDDETVGPVEIHALLPGNRDGEPDLGPSTPDADSENFVLPSGSVGPTSIGPETREDHGFGPTEVGPTLRDRGAEIFRNPD